MIHFHFLKVQYIFNFWFGKFLLFVIWKKDWNFEAAVLEELSLRCKGRRGEPWSRSYTVGTILQGNLFQPPYFRADSLLEGNYERHASGSPHWEVCSWEYIHPMNSSIPYLLDHSRHQPDNTAISSDSGSQWWVGIQKERILS